MKVQYIIAIFIITALASCNNKDNKIAEERATTINENVVTLTDAQIKNGGIQTGKPTTGSMSSILKVSGLVDVPPQNTVSISFPLGGYLKSTHLLEGTHVRKGQSLAVMEHQSLIQLQEDFLVAKSKAYFLQKEYDRQKLLNVNKSSSDKVLEQTESEYQMQRIITNSLKEKLRLIGLNPDKISENNITRSINIYSPIDGYVSAVNVNIGKFVNPSDVLFELVNPSDLHLALKVFEKDVHDIQIGQKIKAYMANNSAKVFEAEVILVSKNLDANRSAMIHCHFEKPEHELLPGMFLNAEIEVVTNNAILVPEEAVVRSGDREYIFIDKGNHHYELTPVKTGNSSHSKIEISSDKVNLLEQNIITTNAYAALMKLQNKAEE
jgi:cobalt-zinc-cadmium efflux system membrane fusion protein